MLKYLLIILFVVAFLSIGLLIYWNVKNNGDSGGDEVVNSDDPVLKKFQASNPKLLVQKHLREDINRTRVFWIKDPGSGRTVILPRSEAESENARVEFLTCDPSEIPRHLLYPQATEPVCISITNDYHKRKAFFFQTNDRLATVVRYYDGPDVSASWLRGNTQERTHFGKLPNGSNGFLYSYFFYETSRERKFVLYALISYKEEKK